MHRRNMTSRVAHRATLISIVTALSIVACASSTNRVASADSGESPDGAEVIDRFEDAAALVREFQGKLPDSVTKEARCVVVIPSMVRGGIIVGGRHGEGFAICRTPAYMDEDWSAPAPVSVSGGSAGAQIGVESVDVLMLVQSDEGMRKLLGSKFQLGVDVSASAGPLGRGREAATDPSMKAEVLSYTRSRGLFAGAELGGTVVKQDEDATRVVYGNTAPSIRTLLTSNIGPSGDGRASWHFIKAVRETMR